MIDNGSFYNSSLECLYIPSCVSKLNEGWCSSTPNLTKIIVSPNNIRYSCLYEEMIISKSNEYSNKYDTIEFVNRNVKTVLIPSFIRKIASFAFEDSDIEKIYIPRQITTICKKAFQHCQKLESVVFAKHSQIQIVEIEAFDETLSNHIDFPLNCIKQNNKTLYDSTDFEKVLEIINSSKDTIELMISSSEDDEIIEACNIEIKANGYEKVIEKIKNKILDSENYDIKSLNRYIENHLSGNIPLLLYIIIDCVANFPIVLSRTASLNRLIYRNHLNIFLSSFNSALMKYRSINTEISINILILLQTLYAIYIFNSSETQQLLHYYLNENELNYIPFVISERYITPKGNQNLKFQKENSIIKEKLSNLKEKIKDLDFRQNQNRSIEKNSNSIIRESQELLSKNKYSRNYSNMYKAVSSVAYIFVSKCYNFFRKCFPLPHETLLRKQISPVIQKYVDNLIDVYQIDSILKEFLHSDKMIHATLAIDAASFMEVKGEIILQKFPSLTSINSQNSYNNLFVFYLQPVNVNMKPFPIHISLKENGAASKEITACIKQIIKILEERQIIIDYVATDGDHQYDCIHEQFFDLIFELHKSNLSFSKMIKMLSKSDLFHIPISDFLHLLKIF